MKETQRTFEWVEVPNNSTQRMRPGTEGNRCYGGGNCLAPPTFRAEEDESAKEFRARVRASEGIVEDLLKQK